MIRRSERLSIVYENLLPQKDVWDICCDHGYLGTAAYKSTKFSDIYFVDRVPATIKKLEIQFQKFVLKAQSASKANFICLAGQDINTQVTGTVCITGVGGLTAFEILEGLAKKNFLAADRLILGPHTSELKLLKLLEDSLKLNHYKLQSEIRIIESKINRTLFVLDKVITKSLHQNGL